MILPLFLVLLAGYAPFWEIKAPGQWTGDELAEVLSASPWVKSLDPPSAFREVGGLHVHLATARPLREAEEELLRRARQKARPEEDPGEAGEEFREFLRENEGRYTVLAVLLPSGSALSDPREIRRMEQESYLRAGNTKLRMAGHFPPVPGDPYLRLVFPRPPIEGAKTILFDLYVPGITAPYRQVEYYLSDLQYKGKPEI